MLPFQFQQMLMHRAQKRMQNSLSLNEISPHLAAISSSCITMPGHNQGDEVRAPCSLTPDITFEARLLNYSIITKAVAVPCAVCSACFGQSHQLC